MNINNKKKLLSQLQVLQGESSLPFLFAILYSFIRKLIFGYEMPMVPLLIMTCFC